MEQLIISGYQFTKDVAGFLFLLVLAISGLMTFVVFYHINFFGIAKDDKKIAKKIFLFMTILLILVNGLTAVFVYYG